jgi:hypothetical protein
LNFSFSLGDELGSAEMSQHAGEAHCRSAIQGNFNLTERNYKTAHKKIADFLLQLQESNPTADLEELVMVEESLNSINRQLTEFIEVSHNHCHSERQKMESMRMQWQQTLNFSTKSSS